jgi:hypothetical protein
MSLTGHRSAEREAARLRHPAMRQPIDLDLMRRREADRLTDAGHPWPVEAAMIIATRGRMGLDRREFCDALGVPEALLIQLEDGGPPSPSSAGPSRTVTDVSARRGE